MSLDLRGGSAGERPGAQVAGVTCSSSPGGGGTGDHPVPIVLYPQFSGVAANVDSPNIRSISVHNTGPSSLKQCFSLILNLYLPMMGNPGGLFKVFFPLFITQSIGFA